MHGNAFCTSAPCPAAESLQAWACSRRRAMGALGGALGWGEQALDGVTPVLAANWGWWLRRVCRDDLQTQRGNSRRKRAGLVQRCLSNPICCVSCSKHWGREYSCLHLVPRLFPELRGLRAISPSAFTAVGSSIRAAFLAKLSNCCFQHDISSSTNPPDYPAARLCRSRIADG